MIVSAREGYRHWARHLRKMPPLPRTSGTLALRRARVFARSLLTGRQSGLIEEAALDESRDRVRLMLSKTPQNAVQALSDDDFEKHRTAGPLFSGVTVNVV